LGDLVTGAVGIAGVLLGLFADRVLQRQGKVRCGIDPISLVVLGTGEEGRSSTALQSLPIPAELLPESVSGQDQGFGERGSVRCSVSAKLFNEKEVRIGLRDVVVAFEGKSPFERKMLDMSTWQPSQPSQYHLSVDTLEVVNLPSREWVTLSLRCSLPPAEAVKLASCDRAWLRGYFPDGSRFNQRIPFAE
jgi:hypothetical protein